MALDTSEVTSEVGDTSEVTSEVCLIKINR